MVYLCKYLNKKNHCVSYNKMADVHNVLTSKMKKEGMFHKGMCKDCKYYEKSSRTL